jgi:hypothetical protein
MKVRNRCNCAGCTCRKRQLSHRGAVAWRAVAA